MWYTRLRVPVTLALLLLLGRGPCSEGAIGSGDPDWSISKAEVVQEFHSYEEPTRVARGLFFPFFGASESGGSGHQGNKGQGQSHSSHPYRPTPPPLPPKHAKFSMLDKKEPNRRNAPSYLPPLPQRFNQVHGPGPLQTSTIGPIPVYPRVQNHQNQVPSSTTLPPPLPLPNQAPNLPRPFENPPGMMSSASDEQTIIWPKNVDASDLLDEDTRLRFLVHKAGDEGEIKKALLTDSAHRGEDVKFIEGPTLRIQRHQKVYLPPKKKTVVYILLKEPQITTDVEVVGGAQEDPVPEVYITYQKSDGGVKTKHYSPEVVKSDKYLNQLRSSLKSDEPRGDFDLVAKNHVTRSVNSNNLGQHQHQQYSTSATATTTATSATTQPTTTICPTKS